MINLGHQLRRYAFIEPIEGISAGIHTAGLPLRSRKTWTGMWRKRFKNYFRALLRPSAKRWYALEEVWVPKNPHDTFSLISLWLRVDPYSLYYLHYRTPSYDMAINGPLFDCDYDVEKMP